MSKPIKIINELNLKISKDSNLKYYIEIDNTFFRVCNGMKEIEQAIINLIYSKFFNTIEEQV